MPRELVLNPNDVDIDSVGIESAVRTPEVVHFAQPNKAPAFSALQPGQVHTLALSRYRDRSVADVARHVFDVYSNDLYIPGIQFRDWVVEHYDSAPPELQAVLAPLANNGNRSHFFDSVVRDQAGFWGWGVPCMERDDSGWRRGIVRWLGAGWLSTDHVDLVVLLDPATT